MMNNNLPKNYKNTEVGVIPEDWEVKQLQHISEKIMVGIASAATHAYRDRGVVMFRNQNIKSNYLDDNDTLFISNEYEELFKGKRLKAGDLLTARTGYPGTTCLLPEKYEGSQSFTTLITRPNQKEIVSEFLCFYINSEIGQSFFETNQIGGGQKNVNAGTLKVMPIPIPPTKSEQTAIAIALSDADALISGLEKLIAKKRSIKQGAMQKLLQPKEGWEVKKLGEICEIFGRIGFRGYTVNDIVEKEQGAITISPSNLQDDKMDFTKCTYISWFKYEESPEIKIFNGDILLVKTGSTSGKTAIIKNLKEKATINPQVVVLKKIIVDNLFLSYVMSNKVVQDQIKTTIVGGAIPTLSQKQIANFKISLPKLKEEQTRISTILSDMDAEIEGLEAKLEKYRAIKLGMMQNLLTGKIRLV